MKGLAWSLGSPTHLLSGEYSHKQADKGLFYFVTIMCECSCVHLREHTCMFTCTCSCVHEDTVCPVEMRGQPQCHLPPRPPCYLSLCFTHQTSWPSSLQGFSCLCLPSHHRRARITGMNPCLALQVLDLQTKVCAYIAVC